MCTVLTMCTVPIFIHSRFAFTSIHSTSRYDALDAWFGRGASVKDVGDTISHEVAEDLAVAPGSKEASEINRMVFSRVGHAYGGYRRMNGVGGGV